MPRIAGAVGLKDREKKRKMTTRLKRKGLVKRAGAAGIARKKKNPARSIPLENVVIARDVSIVKSLLQIARELASIKESIFWFSIK